MELFVSLYKQLITNWQWSEEFETFGHKCTRAELVVTQDQGKVTDRLSGTSVLRCEEEIVLVTVSSAPPMH